MLLFILSVVFALVISGVCSLLEATLLSMTPTQIAELNQKNPRIGAIWSDFKKNIERPIAVILIINTASHTIGATLAGSSFEQVSSDPFHATLFAVVFTFLMLQLSEILPKTIGVQQNTRFAPLIAYPLAFLTKVLTPVSWFVHLLNKPFERKIPDDGRPRTLEDIKALAGFARMSKLIGPTQEKIIASASELAATKVEEVMIPIAEVTWISTGHSLEEAVAVARANPHTRFPVCDDGDLDKIVGYVNFKELVFLQQDAGSDALDEILRPLQSVEPDSPANRLLKIFASAYVHMAIVINAEGKSLGIVTLEDIIEELIGELEDEFDQLPHSMHRLRKQQWLVGGGVHMKDVGSQLGLALPEDEQTLSAWLLAEGLAPRLGASLQREGATFTVRRTRRGKLFDIRVRVPAEGEKAEAGKKAKEAEKAD